MSELRDKSQTKPQLLIIGHGRHGKDSFAELLSVICGLQFTSSSHFVGERCIWPAWGQERYETFEDCFVDRVNYRKTWADLISAWNTPDKARTARTMFEEGNHMYVGMRRKDEFDACMEIDLFDHVIWVDAGNRLPLEPADSMEMVREMADLYVDNNGAEGALLDYALAIQKHLHDEGFYVGYHEPIIEEKSEPVFKTARPIEKPELEIAEEPVEKGDRLTWFDAPEGATPVLDHGFIQVKEVMGSDKDIADSARMSYGRGTKTVNNDQGLINYLVQNHHTSPLEMGEIKFHIRLPIFTMRQWVRHRTANLNEYSGRYSEMIRLFYIPELDKIMYQGLVNKQMSGEPLPEELAKGAQDVMRIASMEAFNAYERLLNEMDVSRETARIVLPLNTYTEVVWKMDVSNLLKFLYLRDDPHSQWEIQVYAREVAKAVKEYFPAVYAAYERSKTRVSLNEDQLYALMTSDTSHLGKGETAVVEGIVKKMFKRAALEDLA